MQFGKRPHCHLSWLQMDSSIGSCASTQLQVCYIHTTALHSPYILQYAGTCHHSKVLLWRIRNTSNTWWRPHDLHHKWHLDWISCFCTHHGCALPNICTTAQRQTYTHRPCYMRHSICSNRSYLRTACRRCGIKIFKKLHYHSDTADVVQRCEIAIVPQHHHWMNKVRSVCQTT